ncbi:MAG: TIGR00341 family protein, partial [Ilumatobacter sp.]|nr:TIGR00341 family protein [Ilumatobacter sp.]
MAVEEHGPLVSRFLRWRISPEERRAVLDAVALRQTKASLWRFAVLQILAVTIAVMGLVTDSAAVVIGAMLVAPLMSPIMGVAASLSMGWIARAARTMLLVLVAAAGSVALAYLLTSFVPGSGLTAEVLARTSPGATDMVVALAAGLAGAYATVRPNVSASLAGVAVAVALVPPLAAVGVALQAGEMGLAQGALLLFFTNLSAIV